MCVCVKQNSEKTKKKYYSLIRRESMLLFHNFLHLLLLSILICSVYPQLIIISCLKCCLISYKQVQAAQVLPIDSLKAPNVTRPLSSHMEPKKRHCSKSIILLVSLALLKSTLLVAQH